MHTSGQLDRGLLLCFSRVQNLQRFFPQDLISSQSGAPLTDAYCSLINIGG